MSGGWSDGIGRLRQMDPSIFATLRLAANLAVFGLAAALVWIAGVTRYVGMVLGGLATSLPEVTTTVAAMRLAHGWLSARTSSR